MTYVSWAQYSIIMAFGRDRMNDLDQRAKGYTGGMEERLFGWGSFLVWFGILSVFVSLFVAGAVTRESSWDEWAENGLNWYCILLGVVVCVQAVTFAMLLFGGSEVIRLLKSANGIQYAGQLKKLGKLSAYAVEAKSDESEGRFRCTACGRRFPKMWDKCPNCDGRLEEES